MKVVEDISTSKCSHSGTRLVLGLKKSGKKMICDARYAIVFLVYGKILR